MEQPPRPLGRAIDVELEAIGARLRIAEIPPMRELRGQFATSPLWPMTSMWSGATIGQTQRAADADREGDVGDRGNDEGAPGTPPCRTHLALARHPGSSDTNVWSCGRGPNQNAFSCVGSSVPR